MATKRFRAGKGYGGAVAVIDTSRKNRAVLIVLPDPVNPKAQGRVLDLCVGRLNEEHERMEAAKAARAAT